MPNPRTFGIRLVAPPGRAEAMNLAKSPSGYDLVRFA
jgi:hypothetical protein